MLLRLGVEARDVIQHVVNDPIEEVRLDDAVPEAGKICVRQKHALD